MSEASEGRVRPIGARINTLERRLDHLRRRASDPKRRQASKDFDLAEIGALELAIEALRRERAEYLLGTTAVELLRRAQPFLEEAAKHPLTAQRERDLAEDIDQLLREIDG